MAEAFKGTNTATDDALSVASVEIARTEFLVCRASSDKGVGDNQDFVPDGYHGSPVAARWRMMRRWRALRAVSVVRAAA